MKGKFKTFHVNMLKKYNERNADQGDSDRGEDAFVSSAVIDCTSDEQEDNDDIPSAGNTDGPEVADVNPELSNDNHHKVTVLLNEFSDVLTDIPDYTLLIEHVIKTNSDQPLRSKSYMFAVPFPMRYVVDDEVKKMLEQNIIECSDSPYCSPVVLV